MTPIRFPINLPELKTWSEIFQSVAVGIGAIGGGFGGYVIFRDWLKRRQKERKIQQLRKRYPRSENGRTYLLTHSPGVIGWIFILDHRTQQKKRHWVKNPETLSDLGFSSADAREIMPEVFNFYSEEEELDTQ